MHVATSARPAPARIALAARYAGARERLLFDLLRVGAAACFVGHGAFGILGKEAWLPYFALFGISAEAARWLMPVVGTVDIAVGLAVLFRPAPLFLAYMTAWGLWTALLRPLAGEPAWETLERAGNYGVPLALLVACGVGAMRTGVLRPCRPAGGIAPAVPRLLALTTALLLVGHGALAAGAKPLLVRHGALAGVGEGGVVALGWAEMALGLLIALRPTAGLALGVAAWKLATEALFPAAGDPVWEFVERGGSYAAPLALAVVLWRRSDAANRGVVPGLPLLIAGLLAAAPPAAQRGSGAGAQDDLLPALRRGGLVLACRHTVTNYETRARTDLPESDRRTQRNLSGEGREQAREFGRAVKALRVPIGRVVASPLYRTWDTAVLAFGAADTTRALASQGDARERRALFFGPVTAGSNRVLVSHQGVLISMFPGHGVGPIVDGECLVVRPGDPSAPPTGRLRLEDWARLEREARTR